MSSKTKRFFSNPLYLLVAVVSVAMLAVGSVLAFNALAANGVNQYYYVFNMSHIYYNGATEDVCARVYYQDIRSTAEKWKVTRVDKLSSTNSTPYFTTDGSDTFSPNSTTHSELTITADVPDENSPGWNKTVWIYKRWRSSGLYYCQCLGSTTVGNLIASGNLSSSLYAGSSYTNYPNASSMDGTVTDTTYADDDCGKFVNPTYITYYYAISDTKPYTFTGTGGTSTSIPSGVYNASFLKNVELFYAANPDIEYTAEYKERIDVQYRDYLLKKSTISDFAFASDVKIPIPKDEFLSIVNARIDILSGDKQTVLYSANIYTYNLDSRYDYITYLNCGGNDSIELEQWLYNKQTGSAGSSNINVPVSLTVKYDYSHYKSADGSNIQDPGDLEEKSEFYKTDLDTVWQSGIFDYQSFTFADSDNSPLFHPQDSESDVWCETEFWRSKDNPASRYEKGSETQIDSLARTSGMIGDALKAQFKFNNSTGYWERKVLIEPIFKNCYLKLQYHDSWYNEYRYDENWNLSPGYEDYYQCTEVYPYVYKDDSGGLLNTPAPPSVKVKSTSNVNWQDCYDYYDFMSNHPGEKFVHWSTEVDNKGTLYQVDNTFEMSSDTDLYAQWNNIVYHIVYDYHSPTGSDDDIIVNGNGYNGITDITTIWPKEIIFSKDTSKNDPDHLNIFDNNGFSYGYGYYDPSSYQDASYNYYSGIYLELSDTATVPDGTSFQYWSLTNYSDRENEYVYTINQADFKEADNGEYYVTVHAIWSQPKYKLVYNENKKDASDTVSNMPDPAEATVTYAELQNGYALSSTIPTYSSASGQSLTFDGWLLEPDSTSPVSIINYSGGLNDGDTINVYAKWIEATSVTYYANVPEGAKIQATGEVPVDSNKYSSAQRATVKGNTGDNALVRTGYVFSGWNTSADGTGTSYVSGNQILMINNVRLYAQWTPLQYELNYNANQKLTAVENMPTTPEQFTIESGNVTEKDGKYIYTFNPDKTPNAFGYEFKGWGETSTAEVNEDVGVNQSVTSLELGDFKEATDEKIYEFTVYAIWNSIEYTLKYDANKQTGMDTVTYVQDKEVPDDKKLTIQQFVKDTDGNYVYAQISERLETDGFTFKGWSTESTATAAQSSLSAANDFKEGNQCTVYAVWQENTYTLVYDGGVGHENVTIPEEETDLPYTAIKGGHTLSAQIPSDTGYTFKGWEVNDVADTLNAGGTVPFAAFNNIGRTATATAIWTINSHNVEYYDKYGNKIADYGGLYEYNTDVEVLSTDYIPAISGYNAKGWKLMDDSASVTIVDGKFRMPDGTVKLQADYLQATHTVTYQSGYEGGNQEDVVVDGIVHGTEHRIQANTFTQTGYEFDKWVLVSPQDKTYPTNPEENDPIIVNDDIVYKATWKIKQFTVTYQDGYSYNTDNDRLFTVDYGTSHTVQEYDLFTRAGYQLTGWQLVSPTTGYSVTKGDEYNVVENVTYKAIWTPNTHWVKYVIDVPSDVSYTKPADEEKAFGALVDVKPEPTGYDARKYTFSGWKSEDVTLDASGKFTMPDDDVTIRGSFNENGKVTLTYDANGATVGTVPNPVTDYTEITETIKGNGDLEKTGYKFDGWNTSAKGDGTIYTVGNDYTFTQDTTIYAKWTPNEYHVRYYDINGNELTSLAETHDYGTDFTVRSNADIPNVIGKKIVGWKFKGGEQTDADGATITGSGAYKMPAGDVEFQAEYNDLIYTVTYQVSNSPSAYTVPETKSYKYGDSVTVEKIPSIEGYNFTGWNCSQADVSGDSFTMPAENVVITGSFSEKGKVTLNYNPNGATSGTVPGTVWDYDELNATIAGNTGNLAKTGYKFEGWSDINGTIYTIDKSYTFTQDITLYAQWGKDSFNVEYYEADGTTPITTHKYEFEASVNVGSGVTPDVGEGEIFVGWVLINNAQQDADGVDIGTRNNYPMPAETVKYKAIITTKTYTVTYVMEGDVPSDLSYNLPVVTTYNHGDTVNVASVPTGYDTSEYTFTGWDYNESGVYYAGGTSKASFNITENVVLKGVWIRNSTPPDPDKATVTYTSGLTGADITDPSLNSTRSEQITLGSDYTVHANDGWTNYVRPGYKFVNWKVVAPKVTGISLFNNIYARFAGPAVLGQTFIGGDTVTALSEDITLEAQWEAEKYNIIYDANGATSGTVPTDDADYSYQETATVKDKGDLAKDGANFLNWNTDPNGNGITYAANAQITMIEDVTLYAIWDAEPSYDIYYTLKYDANGATGGSVPQDYTHYLGGEKVTVANKGNLSKANCTFKEWNTQADGKGTGYKENTDVLTMPKRDVTLYAIWVDSEGRIVSPGTGESALGIQIAFSAIIISMLAGGYVVMMMLKKRRYG